MSARFFREQGLLFTKDHSIISKDAMVCPSCAGWKNYFSFAASETSIRVSITCRDEHCPICPSYDAKIEPVPSPEQFIDVLKALISFWNGTTKHRFSSLMEEFTRLGLSIDETLFSFQCGELYPHPPKVPRAKKPFSLPYPEHPLDCIAIMRKVEQEKRSRRCQGTDG